MLSDETIALELLNIAPALQALRDAFGVLNDEVNKTSLHVLQIKDAVDKSHDALVESIAKNDQERKLQYFAEWCFAVEKSRPQMAAFALAAVRLYLEKWHAPEEIDVYMATRKLNATRSWK